MADNGSQAGTSAGSSNIITTVSRCKIGNLGQHNYPTPSTSTHNTNVDIDYCPAPVSTFLARYEELRTLKTLFTQHQVVVLVGLGGLGKTQLARKYIQINKADYQYKYWLESETPETLANSFIEFAKKLHVESDSIEDVVNDVYEKIKTVPTIIVFDNVKKPEHVYAYLPTRTDVPSGVTIHVLITSRWTDWSSNNQIQCYKLQPFNVSESLEIFEEKFGETCIDTMQDEWEELARMLGYLPLALQVATSYIHKRTKHNSDLRPALADYMKQLREGAGRLLNDNLTQNYKTGNIENHLTHNKSYVPLEPKSKRQNIVNNTVLPVNTFIGRVSELGDIEQSFDQYPIVVIVGMGGMGKTQLARKFSFENANVYKNRYWINAETPEQLLKSFDRLATKVDVKAVIDIDKIRETYRSFHEGAALLVFDNVETPADVYAYLPTRVDLPPGVTIHVLITSRWADWTCDEQIQCYKLQPFNVTESLEIFEEKFRETCMDTMQKEWKELARMLGYLPLALQVATSYIYKRSKHNSDLPMVLADYMKQLREGADGLLNDPLIEYDNRSVSTSMLLTLKQLENKTDDKWKFAVTLINAAAYMNPDRIYKDNLSKLLDNSDNTCILDGALSILTDYSLFNQGMDLISNKYSYYTVHRIIQTSIRYNQTAMGTADIYFIGALKYALANNYFLTDVLQYANERTSAVVHYYKDNPSPILLSRLVECKAITAVRAVFKIMSRNQIQSLIQEENLLYLAVKVEDLSMAQLLHHNGADINQLCRKLRIDMLEPPLHLALRRRNMEITTWLLENGATLTQRNREGGNALHTAIMSANHKMVPIIIKTDRAVVNETDNDGNTPLLSIDYSNNEEDILSTIRVLVECGADTTAVDNTGNTVLHSATRYACAAVVSLILQLNKALINIVNKFGETALHVMPYDDTRIDDERILLITRVLIESGVDIAKVDRRGNTVLHLAARWARGAAVSLILQLNKDLIDIVNNDGETALHVIPYAYGCRLIDHERILSTTLALVEGGLDLTKVDKRGNTVLHSATKGACLGAVSLFLQRNKDLINIVNEDGQTALHVLGNGFSVSTKLISEYHRKLFALVKETVQILIMNGLLLHTRDNRGRTPLDTINPDFKDILLQVADDCNNQILVHPVKR